MMIEFYKCLEEKEEVFKILIFLNLIIIIKLCLLNSYKFFKIREKRKEEEEEEERKTKRKSKKFLTSY